MSITAAQGADGISSEAARPRCEWALGFPLMTEYHDREWGVPMHDDRLLFELLTLEGAQAGLSWATILKKRAGYRETFAGFDPAIVARFGPDDIVRLVQSPLIVRNRSKIESTVGNAGAILSLIETFGSFNDYIWGFVGGNPIQNAWKSSGEIPAQTLESQAMSKDLKRRGFRFVGPTICYAFMQSAGLVNDHLVSCHRYRELSRPS
jgi:DNA-3-methyladenine glycosylase I